MTKNACFIDQHCLILHINLLYIKLVYYIKFAFSYFWSNFSVLDFSSDHLTMEIFTGDQVEVAGNDEKSYFKPSSNNCGVCGKSFKTRDSLYKHRKIHIGQTKCPICFRVLSRLSHKRRHMQTKHPENFT